MKNRKNRLDDSILVLKLDIKKLTEMIIKQYRDVIQAIKDRDSKLALKVIEGDDEINGLAEDIDLESMVIIARYQPVATDLRRVMTINKLAYELERIADYAKNIAGYVITGNEKNVYESPTIIASLEGMFHTIIKMLEINLDALYKEDKVLAREALMLDNEIDDAYERNFHELLDRFKQADDSNVQHMISMAFILNKQIERAGDHLTNISEHILYLIKGKRYYDDKSPFVDDIFK